MTDFRQKIVTKLKRLLDSDKNIYSVWEGGSAATGYLDDYSDLDLGIICADDAIDNVFRKLEEFLSSNYGIKHKLIVPEPSWHGHSQRFYILEKTDPYFYLDILVEKLSSGNRFTESDRHGNSVVWFDKKDLIDPTPTPEEEIVAKGKNIFQRVKQAYPFLLLDVNKQILRGNQVDAFELYFRLLNRLGVLLNLKYRHHKYDFGLRYAIRDFPEEIVQLLRKLLFPGKFEDLAECTKLVEVKILELIDELNVYWQ